MRITMLGTGSADGWPNPFCSCESCATERAAGRARRPSSALIDERILIDCGPTTPHLPPRASVTLQHVEHVLLTHGHPDHLHPAFLLTRRWTSPEHLLHVWGPALAIDMCRDWVGPDSAVELHVVAPGADWTATTSASDYRIAAHAAAHAHGDGDVIAAEALIFSVTAPAGDRLLYATDTGPLSSTVIASLGGHHDVVILDETFGDKADHGTGHLDLLRLPDLLDDLRAAGVIEQRTQVVATHLSHHNPPSDILSCRLADLGVRLPQDMDVLETAHGDAAAPEGRAIRRLLLGGARSGKSSAAESLASAHRLVTYVATGGTREGDAEWQARIDAHRARRPAHWRTLETTDLEQALASAESESLVLIDCLALWLTSVLDELDAWSRCEAGDRARLLTQVDVRIDGLVAALRSCPADVILVSNEVGMGVVPATASGRLFRDLLGVVNMRVADACDETHLVIAGRILPLSAAVTSW